MINKLIYINLFILIFTNSKCTCQISKDFEIEKLSKGVYAAIHKSGGRAICNAGIVDLGDATLVFDPFISPYAAEELKRVLQEMGLPPVKYVVNSHYHNDHIRGNQVFKDAEIYSTQLTKQLIEKNEPEEIADENENLATIISKSDSTLAAVSKTDTLQKRQHEFWNSYYKTILESHKILKTVLPNKIVSGSLKIKGSKQTAELIEMGMGHTSSDLIVYIPQSKIIFTGDLLFIKNHPWIADANLDSLKSCLTKLKTMNPYKLIPGHGPVGTKKDIDVLLNYLDKINNEAGLQVNKGLLPDQLKEIAIPVEYQNWLLSSFYIPNIRFQMKQLQSISLAPKIK
jgi:cyclase